MDIGAWQAAVHGVAKSQTRQSTHALGPDTLDCVDRSDGAGLSDGAGRSDRAPGLLWAPPSWTLLLQQHLRHRAEQ